MLRIKEKKEKEKDLNKPNLIDQRILVVSISLCNNCSKVSVIIIL